ncbi:MAG: 3-deoxy-8-phosphooctulonate synthase [Pseudomonadota bacterium]|nr:3-deoxy-8-phosphooctulonate synthase [Pseudomonadota bacterium]
MKVLNENFFGEVNMFDFFKDNKLAIIAGPCVIENKNITFQIATELKDIAADLDINFIFKASFDKANRSSIESYRGPGIESGLDILAEVKQDLKVPVLTDVHDVQSIQKIATVVDILQIPAFLCRQTDLVVTAAKSMCTVKIKKGQFMAPWDMQNVLGKAYSTGNKKIILTERGSCFGYNNLIVDMRSLAKMREFGAPVVFDMTHSVQLPGGAGKSSSGQREYIAPLARAAIACGVDGLFFETHPDPSKALSDGPNSIFLKDVRKLLSDFKVLHECISNLG